VGGNNIFARILFKPNTTVIKVPKQPNEKPKAVVK
jgi:hypothetical protein